MFPQPKDVPPLQYLARPKYRVPAYALHLKRGLNPAKAAVALRKAFDTVIEAAMVAKETVDADREERRAGGAVPKPASTSVTSKAKGVSGAAKGKKTSAPSDMIERDPPDDQPHASGESSKVFERKGREKGVVTGVNMAAVSVFCGHPFVHPNNFSSEQFDEGRGDTQTISPAIRASSPATVSHHGDGEWSVVCCERSRTVPSRHPLLGSLR